LQWTRSVDWNAAPAKAPLGRFQLTYYWLAHERRSKSAEADAMVGEVLRSKHCEPIAEVSPHFAERLSVEGSGVLKDGRVVSIAGNCECGSPCYHLSRRSHPFGTGVDNRPLSPFRSVAVDPNIIEIGSLLYIADLDGMVMPGEAPWGGFVHDGCVVADDQGGSVDGHQLDFFTAKRAHYVTLSRLLGKKQISVFDGTYACAGKLP
jgi:3D (Asp-Asp-Asp) domain-containing protein